VAVATKKYLKNRAKKRSKAYHPTYAQKQAFLSARTKVFCHTQEKADDQQTLLQKIVAQENADIENAIFTLEQLCKR